MSDFGESEPQYPAAPAECQRAAAGIHRTIMLDSFFFT
jgi:hypothetical protein